MLTISLKIQSIFNKSGAHAHLRVILFTVSQSCPGRHQQETAWWTFLFIFRNDSEPAACGVRFASPAAFSRLRWRGSIGSLEVQGLSDHYPRIVQVKYIIPISSGCSCHYRECAECRRAQRGFQPRNDVLASRAANFRGRAAWQAAGRLWFSSDPQFGGTPGAEYGRGFEYRQFAYCHQFHWPCPIAHPLCAQLDWLQYNILITKYIMHY